MKKTTYTLKLFHLLQQYRRAVEREREAKNTAKGFIFAGLICIAIWSVIVTLSIVVF